MMSPQSETPDFTNWLTKEQAAETLKVSTKSVERYATQGKLQRKYVPKEGQRPMPLFNPDDVQRLSAELCGVSPFVLKGAEIERIPAAREQSAVPAKLGEVALKLMEKALLNSGDSPIWIPLKDAAKASGLPKWYLETAIATGKLPAHNIARQNSRQRRLRVRRADLEALAGNSFQGSQALAG
jgi:hypothetical protein